MVYYNPDGSTGMMCGNGGRCIVAFAADLGFQSFDFEAADGFHTAEIIADEGREKIIRLQMQDVTKWQYFASINLGFKVEGYYLETGTRHFVNFVENIEDAEVVEKGRAIRHAKEFAPTGVNTNFVIPIETGLRVRTYEKGVEDETFACGTGIVASAIAAYIKGIEASEKFADGRLRYLIEAKRDRLFVDFIPLDTKIEAVYLTGPATYIAKIMID